MTVITNICTLPSTEIARNFTKCTYKWISLYFPPNLLILESSDLFLSSPVFSNVLQKGKQESYVLCVQLQCNILMSQSFQFHMLTL